MPSTNRRPDQHDRSFIEQARRAQITKHAIDTIAELGYAAASFEQIARRAKISRSLISYHFASRDDLMREVLATVYAAGAEFMAARISLQGTAAEALASYISSNVEFIGAYRNHVVAVMNIVLNARSAKLSDQPESDAAQPRADGVKRILGWGQATGEFRAFSIPAMAIAVLQGIDGAYSLLDDKGGIDLPGYAAELAATFELATRKETR